MHDKILILDFGSQVTQLIARRVRECQVYCEIHPNDVSDEFIRSYAPKGIILSGSHASTYEDHQLRAPQAVWDLGVPESLAQVEDWGPRLTHFLSAGVVGPDVGGWFFPTSQWWVLMLWIIPPFLLLFPCPHSLDLGIDPRPLFFELGEFIL